MTNRFALSLFLLAAIAVPAGCGGDDAGGGGSDAPVAVNEVADVPVDDADPDATQQPQGEEVLLKLQHLERGSLSSEIPAIRGSEGLSVQDWMSTVDGDVASYWQSQFNRAGYEYRVPSEYIYDRRGHSGCGPIGPDDGPFYCSADETIYLPLPFFNEQYQRFGDAAVAVVIAHENGHHIQQLLGVFNKGYLTPQTELQADCLAGVWASSVLQRGLLEDGDISEILGLTEISGDQAGTPINDPQAHGSSALRADFFNRGYEGGKPEACPVPSRAEIKQG
jgi:predicted metalloprotease